MRIESTKKWPSFWHSAKAVLLGILAASRPALVATSSASNRDKYLDVWGTPLTEFNGSRIIPFGCGIAYCPVTPSAPLERSELLQRGLSGRHQNLQELDASMVRIRSWVSRAPTVLTDCFPTVSSILAVYLGATGRNPFVVTTLVQASMIGTRGRPIDERSHELRRIHRALQENSPVGVPSIANAIRRVDAQIEAQLKFNPEGAAVLLRRRQGILAALPQKTLDLSRWQSNCTRVHQIDCKVDRLLAEYPDNREELRRLVASIRVASGTKRIKRVQALLQGEPGTGKTRFVRLLAQSLGLPLYEISFNTKNVQERLFGNPMYGAHALVDASVEDSTIVGQIAFALISSGIQNPILFFDEAGEHVDRVDVRDTIKRLLGSETFSVQLRAFGEGVELDVSRAVVLLASNSQLVDSALSSRLPTLHFNGLSHAVRKRICREHGREVLSTDYDALPHKARMELSRQFAACVGELCRQDLVCGTPGVRVLLQVTDRLIDHLVEQMEMGRPFDLEGAATEIEKAFQTLQCRGG